jgi:hypothetical protein
VSWLFDLDAQQSWEAKFSFRAPTTVGPATLSTVVNAIDPASGVAAPYGDPLVLSLDVVGAGQSGKQAIAALMAYAPLDSKDSKLRDKLVADVGSAMAAFNLNTAAGYETAIAQLLDVVEQLSALQTVNTGPVHVGLNRIVREAQWHWSQLASD